MPLSLDMGGWVAAGVAAVILGGGCLWFRYEARQAQKSAAIWESSARGAQAALEKTEAARRAAENALEKHRETLSKLEQERDSLRAKLGEARLNDEELRRWYDAPLPASLSGMLSDGGSSRPGSGDNSSPDASPIPDARTAFSGDKQRGFAGMGATESGGVAPLQRGQAGDTAGGGTVNAR